jgi:hypothetical protein
MKIKERALRILAEWRKSALNCEDPLERARLDYLYELEIDRVKGYTQEQVEYKYFITEEM